MRKAVIGITALFLAALQNATAGTLTVRDYAVNSDVVLESIVREVKSIPEDTVNLVGDAVTFVNSEVTTTATGIASVFKADPMVKIEKNAMIGIADAWTSANDIIFRSYKVSDPVGNELTAGMEVEPGTPVDVSGFFSGLSFPKGTSAVYRPEFNRLAVRQTLENVLFIEDMLAEQHNAKRELMGKQVEIQTKFIEVSQKTLNELGFNWTFDRKGGNTGAANIFDTLTLPAGQDLLSAGLRTAGIAGGAAGGAGTAAFGSAIADSATLTLEKSAGSLQWSMVINALEQADDSDVLSAPSITTRDGKTANIWVGEQRMIPRRFNAKSQNTSVFIEHSDWRSELMGVQMEVTPELRAGDLIDLELKPKVIDLIGYDTWQVTPGNASMIVWAGANSLSLALPTSAAGNIAATVTNEMLRTFVAPVLYIPGKVETYWNKLYESFLARGDAPNVAREKANLINSDTRRPVEHDEFGTPIPQLNGSLPYFRLREMTTQVTVADGSTVGMGGLIYEKLETFKDKVPVLGSIPLIGRIFRSEGERSIKRNLMIFVTATQVDVNGRRASDLAMRK